MQHPRQQPPRQQQRPPYTGRGPPNDPRALTPQQTALVRAGINQGCNHNRIDIHEWQSQQLKTQGDDDSGGPQQQYFSAAATTAADSGQQLEVGFEPYEFYFDSINRDAASDLPNGLLGFTIGGLNSGQSIKNVIMIRISSFFFPRITLPASSPDFFFFNRVYLSLVSPFPANQAILAANSKRYHFEFNVSNVGGLGVLLTPVQDRVVFRVPIQSMTGIQFLFLMPPNFTPVNLPQDTIQVRAVPGSNPATFTITDPGVTTAAIGVLGAQPAPGVAIYVSDFASGTTLDPVVNNPGGFFATNNLSLTQFQTNLNFTTLTTPTPATIVVGKNRIAIQLEAVCATDHPTNYVKLMQV